MNFALKGPEVCRLISALLLLPFVIPAQAQNPEALHHARRAQQWMTAKQYDASLPEWEAALQLDLYNAQFHNLYGLSLQAPVSRALISFRRPQAAIRFLQEAGETGALPETPLLLAEALLEAGDPAGALAVLDTQKPAGVASNFTEMELRGSCLLKLERKEEARQQFQLLVEHFPKSPEAYVHATQILLEEKNWEEALRILNSGLERLPGDWLLLLRRAVVYRLSGRLREARRDVLDAVARGGDMSLVLAA